MRIEIIFCLVLMVFLVQAADTTFIAGTSRIVDDKNITLVRFDRGADKALFCVNGERSIINEGKTKNVNGALIRVREVRLDRVITDIDYRCRGCVCDQNCDNSACFKYDQAIEEEFENSKDENGDGIPDDEAIGVFGGNEEVIEPVGIGTQTMVIMGLLLIVLVLGIITLWRMR